MKSDNRVCIQNRAFALEYLIFRSKYFIYEFDIVINIINNPKRDFQCIQSNFCAVSYLRNE